MNLHSHRVLGPIAIALAAALNAQQRDPILAELSADATNVVVVRDVMPVIDRILAAPVAEALLAGTAALQSETFGNVFDAATLRRQLATVAALVPTEIVIAAPARTLDRLSHAGALFACCTVLQILDRSGETDADVLAPIRAAASTHLAQLDGLDLQAWVGTRDERTAESWFDTLSERVPALAQQVGFTAKVLADRIEVHGDVWAPDAAARRVLAAAGVDVAATTTAPIALAFEQRGARISLRVGTMAPGPCPAARLGAAWSGSAEQLVFVRSEPGEHVASLAEAYSSVAKLGDVELSADDLQIMLRLLAFLGRVDAAAAQQTLSIGVARGFEWVHEVPSAAGADAGEGVPTVLRRLMRAEEPAFATVDSLDVLLGRALTQAAPDELPPGTSGEALEQFFDGDASAVFAPGVLLVARPAAMRGRQGRVEPLPFAAVALVARPKSRDEGAAFVRKVTDLLAPPNGAEPRAIWREADLGLGSPAHVLALDELWPELAAQRFDWDFAPHWFVTDDLLVLSSDPALTRELLARAAGGTPAPRDGGVRHETLHVSGASIGDAANAMLRWAPVLREFDDLQAERSVPLWEALRAVADRIDAIEFVSETRDGVLRDRYGIRLRAAPPK